MSLGCINPKSNKTEIKNTMSQILRLFQLSGDNDSIFIILNKLDCLINVFIVRGLFLQLIVVQQLNLFGVYLILKMKQV